MEGADRLARFFDGADLGAKSSLAAYLVTIGADGWPHTAMISAGELLIGRGHTVRLALWAGSRSTANLTRDGRAVLLIVLEQQAIRARLEIRVVESDDALTYFAGSIVAADADTAPYAELRAGVTYELHDTAATIERWTRTIARLRALSS